MATITSTSSSAVLRLEDIPEPQYLRTSSLRVGAMTRYAISYRSAVIGHVVYWAERVESGRGPAGRGTWTLYPDGVRPWVQTTADGLPTLTAARAAALANVRESDRVAVRVHGVTYAALGLPEPGPESESLGPVANPDGTPSDVTRAMLAGTGRDPEQFAARSARIVAEDRDRERAIAATPPRSSGGPFPIRALVCGDCWAVLRPDQYEPLGGSDSGENCSRCGALLGGQHRVAWSEVRANPA